jgi:WD40 repeat protein
MNTNFKEVVQGWAADFVPNVPDHALLRRIGRGSYGEVWLARNAIGQYRAIKVVYRRTFEQERPYEREFSGISRFEPVSRMHEGLVDVLQVGRNDQAGYYYYVIELADDIVSGQEINPERYQPSTLDRMMSGKGRLPVAEVLKLALSLTSALEFLHGQGLIHRDVKPSNIVLVNGTAKISDVGLVARMGASQTFVGTEGYIPPEGPGTAQADIYSLGKVLYEISTGLDRNSYPALPEGLDDEQHAQFLEFNDILVKACEGESRRRYRSMEDMREDLLLLESGQSVRRLRMLERRMALLSRGGLAGVGLFLLCGGAWHQMDRSAKRDSETRNRQVGSCVASGRQSMDQGDLFASLPWFARALRFDQGRPEREAPHRIRLAATLQQCPRLERVFVSGEGINFAELSPGNDLFISASQSGEVTVYDPRDGRVLGRLGGHLAEIQTASFSNDGRFIVTASLDGTARLWEAGTLRELVPVSPLRHKRPVNSARFNSLGERVVTSCDGGWVTVWDTCGGSRILEFNAHQDVILDASFNPEGTLIVTASQDETARIWRAETGQPVGEALRHGGWVFQASFSPDGRLVATADFDRVARVWDLRLGQQIAVLRHEGPVRSAQFSPDGRYLVTGSWDDHAIRIWDLEAHRLVGPPMRHSANVMHAVFSSDGRRIVSAGSDRTARLWDLAPSRWLPAGKPDVLLLSTGCSVRRNGDAIQISPSRPAQRSDLPLENCNPPRLALLSGDSARVITVHAGETGGSTGLSLVQVWESSTGRLAFPEFICADPLTNVVTSRDGTRIASVASGEVQVWSTVTGLPLSHVATGEAASGGSFDPNGAELALAIGSTVRFYRSEGGVLLKTLQQQSTVRHIEFSPDGSRMAIACSDEQNVVAPRNAVIWDLRDGRATALKHRDGVLHASFSPDGNRVVTASKDRYAQVWQVSTGAPVGRILNHKHHVTFASFSPDGRWVLTVCRDRTTRVWDAETGDPLTPPLQDVEILREAHFSQDSRTVQTLSFRGTLRSWSLPEAPGSAASLELLAELLSGRRGVQADGFSMEAGVLGESWSGPGRFAVSPEEIAAWQEHELEKREGWHRQQALVCEEKEQWFAVLFHLGKLLAICPEDKELLDRTLWAGVQWVAALAVAR